MDGAGVSEAAAGVQGSPRRGPVQPPEGFKPDLKRGLAWCPWCGEVKEFAWDAETWYARCPACGVSAEDFYTKTCNGLWGRAAAARFEAAVKASGRRFSWKGGGA